MAVPNRYTIVQTLMSQLQSISILNGYKTDVAAVERMARIMEEVSRVTRRPFIGIMPGAEAFEGHPSKRFRVEFQVFLTLIVDGAADGGETNEQTIGKRLSNLQDDVFRALSLNPRLVNLGLDSAVDIYPVRAGTSEGDNTSVHVVKAGYMEMELKCVYWRDFGGT